MTCKLIDNGVKAQISIFSGLLTLGLFLFFGNRAMYDLTSPVFKSTGEGIHIGGLLGHAALAALVAGIVTYLGMPSGDHKSCEV